MPHYILYEGFPFLLNRPNGKAGRARQANRRASRRAGIRVQNLTYKDSK